MAGSYNHVVTDAGNLASNELVVGMLENGGDVFEAVEEMYGMIWWLAAELVNHGQIALIALEETQTVRFEMIKNTVEKARQEYKDGLGFSKAIHELVPDQRRS